MPASIIDDEVHRRAQLTMWFTGILAGAIAFGTVVRPLLSDHGPVFTLLGALNTLVTFGAWWLMHTGRLVARAPLVLVGLATLMAVPLVVVSGGPNSQFASLVPLFPVCGVLLGGRRMAIATFALWAVVLPLMTWFGPDLPDLTRESWNADKAISRTFWLILSGLIALLFALHVERRTRDLQQRLLDLVERDPLTGIENRRAFENAFRRLVARAARHDRWLGLLMIDVDHFKRYNDARGHAEGDVALRLVADTLRAHTREGQDTVARYGGEEFVVLLDETDPEGTARVAGNIRVAVRALGLRYELGGSEMLTVTVGTACARGRAARDRDALLRRADAALYHGKAHGRDCIVDASHLGAAPGTTRGPTSASRR